MQGRIFARMVAFVMTMMMLLSPITPVRATAPGSRMASERSGEGFHPVGWPGLGDAASLPGWLEGRGDAGGTVAALPRLAATSHVVSGTVSDGTAGWPLYAHLTITDSLASPPVLAADLWTDPASGAYSVTLAAGRTYTFHVEAWVEGYHGTDVEVGPLTADRTTEITLSADLESCTAPGYAFITVLEESFDETTIPDGWAVLDNAGTDAVWAFDNPGGRSNNTGGEGNFAIADSDDAGSVDMDTELHTPLLDLSLPASITLQFRYSFRAYSEGGGDEVADVDVSQDGGSSWSNVWRRTGDSDLGPKTATIDISSLVAGQSNAMIRFHYYGARFDWYWEVDDVLVEQWECGVSPGGLMVGNVYDKNTGESLEGATIVSAAGEQATAVSTEDPEVDDGFFTIFLPEGTQTVTSTQAGGYEPETVSVTTAVSDTLWQTFSLPAGRLAYTPSAMDVRVGFDTQVTRLLTLTNTGSYTTTYELTEVTALPWFSEAPVNGTLPATEMDAIVMTFDTHGFQQPGAYHGAIHFTEPTPYTVEDLPVTMTIPVPPTWGKMTGVVSTSGHCDEHLAPLPDAEVLIQGEGETYSTTTEASGDYGWWIEAGTYTVTILADGYFSASAQITVQAQVTSTQDFMLRADRPCPKAFPQSFQVQVVPGTQTTRALTLSNKGTCSYTFQMMETTDGYAVRDSDDASGPIYDWIEISGTASTLLLLGNDEIKGPLPIGFSFPFYGNTYDQFYISSNGFVAFQTASAIAFDQCPLPNTRSPNNLIAVMWDDLNPRDTADPLYYQSFSSCPYGGDGACLIVEYSGYHHFSSGDEKIAGTFQVILFDYGSILVQFEDVGSERGSGSTTGIENANGTRGVLYACGEADSLTDKLAVCFAAPGELVDCRAADGPSLSWVSVAPVTGTMMANTFENMEVLFDATHVAPGDYSGFLYLHTSDSISTVVAFPLTVVVKSEVYLPLVMKDAQP